MVDQLMMQSWARELSTVGRLAAGGWWRALGTDDDIRARAMVSGWFRDVGLTVRTDAAGNLYGRMEGTSSSRPAVVTGSHLDTVYMGGQWDGAAGLIASLAAVHSLISDLGRPVAPVEVVATCEEEGSRFAGGYVGSRAIAGRLTPDDLKARADDCVTLGSAIARAGGDPERIETAGRDDIAAFIELHIEQARNLERAGARFGVVRTVTGVLHLAVVVPGRADHAGTTAMDQRDDALVPAARFIADLPGIVATVSARARGTVGRLVITPGSKNVVPGRVEFTIDLREVDGEVLRELERRVVAALPAGCTVEVVGRQEPVVMDESLRRLAREAANVGGIESVELDSGAGHDAQVVQGVAPSCLLFIPCRDGRSHCPEEHCSIDDVAMGAEVIAGMVRELAWT